jgi:hypothetical protein
MRATFAVPTATNKADSGFFVLSMLRRLCKGAEPMTRPPLSVAQIVPTTRQKAMLALSFLALSTLGMIHPAKCARSYLYHLRSSGLDLHPTEQHQSERSHHWKLP